MARIGSGRSCGRCPTFLHHVGLLRAILSAERVRDYVRGKPRWLARTLAILLGAVTPFCSCSSVVCHSHGWLNISVAGTTGWPSQRPDSSREP